RQGTPRGVRARERHTLNGGGKTWATRVAKAVMRQPIPHRVGLDTAHALAVPEQNPRLRIPELAALAERGRARPRGGDRAAPRAAPACCALRGRPPASGGPGVEQRGPRQ